jgi:hypothetical protein
VCAVQAQELQQALVSIASDSGSAAVAADIAVDVADSLAHGLADRVRVPVDTLFPMRPLVLRQLQAVTGVTSRVTMGDGQGSTSSSGRPSRQQNSSSSGEGLVEGRNGAVKRNTGSGVESSSSSSISSSVAGSGSGSGNGAGGRGWEMSSGQRNGRADSTADQINVGQSSNSSKGGRNSKSSGGRKGREILMRPLGAR